MIPKWLEDLSVWINKSLGGSEGMSLCGHFYKRRLETNSWWWKLVVRTTDKLFWFDPQHCRKAYLRGKKK